MLLHQVILLVIILISIDKCDSRMEGKVVKGFKSEIEEFPHAVYIEMTENNRMVGACGSSVLNQRILITAAHCFDGCKRCGITARAGDTYHEDANTVIRGFAYVVHRDYNTDTNFADIALIGLIKDLPLGKTIKRVILRRSFPTNAVGDVAGWGAIDDFGTPSIRLKNVNQKVWILSSCFKYEPHLPNGMFCAQSEKGYPYRGDSGSALLTRDYQIIGLVSYRYQIKKDLIMYTNVSSYYDWIREKSAALICKDSK